MRTLSMYLKIKQDFLSTSMEFCFAGHECTCTQQVHNVPYLMIFTHLRQQHKRNNFSVATKWIFCYDRMQNAHAFAKVTSRRPRSAFISRCIWEIFRTIAATVYRCVVNTLRRRRDWIMEWKPIVMLPGSTYKSCTAMKLFNVAVKR